MSVDELRVLLDQVHDTREVVLRGGERWTAAHDVWREAHQEALDAYRGWRRVGRSRIAYCAYRAAQDREDAAQDALAAAAA
jgi:hypothetical protein